MKQLLKSMFPLILTTIFSVQARAQLDTVRIKTTAICEMCKEKIEHGLSFEKGIKSSMMNLATKEVTVIYNSEKTDLQKIRAAITKIGYDADSLKANEKAFNRLPECCRIPGSMMENHSP